MVQRRESGREEINIIELEGGTRIALPGWMLDGVHCQQLPQEARPRIGIGAFVRLAELTAQANCLGVEVPTMTNPSPSTQGKHAVHEPVDLSASAVAAGQDRPVEPAARSQENSMPPIADAAPAERWTTQGGNPAKEQR